jgi:hypothetical protein
MGASAAAVAAPIVGQAIGGLIGGGGAAQAANTSAQGQNAAAQTLQNNYNNLSPYYQPYINLGTQGTTALSNMANSGYLTNQFGSQDLNANLAPNYAFQLQQGQAGQNAASNATGGLVSGNAQQALQNYTQNYAQNAYQNAFTNYQAQRQNVLANASSLATIGQNNIANLGNLATGTAQGIAGYQTGAANATAAGYVGAANALAPAASNIGQYSYLGSLLNQGQGMNTYGGYGSATEGSSNFIGPSSSLADFGGGATSAGGQYATDYMTA